MKTAYVPESSSGNSSGRERGNRAAAASTSTRTGGSASCVHATPTSTSSSDSTRRGSKPGTSPASILAQASTDVAIGPAQSKLGASGQQPSSDTSPWVGFSPTTPQHAAGMRIDPAESVPRAAAASPAASAAAEPPLEPPATRPGASGFGTAPKCGFSEVVP